ncbi:MAG: TRAP transporter large permease subunit [Sphingobacterium sp.]|nr:TRAP transporter large permease subunit [Sphingobacterium sp.]
MQLTRLGGGAPSRSKYVFLLLLNLALLVVGCFMDIFSAILVVVPLIIPLGNLLRHPPGPPGHHLPGQPGAGVPDAAGRAEPVPGLLPVQRAHRPGLQGRARSSSLHRAGGGAAHHLCAPPDHGPAYKRGVKPIPFNFALWRKLGLSREIKKV